MKKIFFYLFIVLLSSYLLYHPKSVLAIDLMNYMGTDYNYQGFTPQNSYLEFTAHEYEYNSQTNRWEWFHKVPYITCPAKYTSCKETDWHFPYQWRKRSDENIWIMSKNPNIGANQEVFWYNSDWVYVLSEGGWYRPGINFSKNYFHNMSYASGVEFPNRGQIWFKRNFNSGDSLYTPGIIINNYTDMQKINAENFNLPISWSPITLTANYYPSWNSASNTWDGQPDNGNLPQDLDVVVLDSKSDAAQTREKYFYARKDNDKYGLIRFESWQTRNFSCGIACPNAVSNGDWILTTYNTFNLLTKFSDTPGFDNPEKFFRRYNYTDPKLEKSVGDGRQERGKIKAPGNGKYADGTEFVSGNWVTLSEIVTDSDYLISTPENVNGQIRECPDGYRYLGSFSGEGCTHQGNCFQDRWVVLCGTTYMVILTDNCPVDYSQKGFFYSNREVGSKTIYDYQRRDISHGWVNFCVHEDEFTYMSPSPAQTPTSVFGDLNGDRLVNNGDLNILIANFGKPGTLGQGDLNNNGRVDIFDFNKLVGEMGI